MPYKDQNISVWGTQDRWRWWGSESQILFFFCLYYIAKLNSELFVYFEIQILGKAITIKYILDTILMHRNRRISEFRYRIINIYFLNYRKYCANYKLALSAFETIRILTVEKYALKNFIFHLYCELTRQKNWRNIFLLQECF